MNYQNTLNYLYTSAPMFQQIGSKAYKEGLENTYALDEHLGHPHRTFRTIHVGGTNGKGSCTHTLAAILQLAGYRVGLYTSPHLIDFRERIRVNGKPISESFVIEFVEEHRAFFEPLQPSFFELTTAMAFLYFAQQKVDVAIIEVGMGGRLDCTNIIHPDLCIITNISLDHTQFLGDTLAQIAMEKAGIMKQGVPVVIGETTEETKPVFTNKAKEIEAPILFAEEQHLLLNTPKVESQATAANGWMYNTAEYGNIVGELGGICQIKNTTTILAALQRLKELKYEFSPLHVAKGFREVTKVTGLQGRWQKLQSNPTLICDTGHNVGGITDIVRQLKEQTYNRLHIVVGMVNDKDIQGVLKLLPQDATYYFTRAGVDRALPAQELMAQATAIGLIGDSYPDVLTAVKAAQEKSLPEDFIFVGGSTFIVADLLANRNTLNLD